MMTCMHTQTISLPINALFNPKSRTIYINSFTRIWAFTFQNDISETTEPLMGPELMMDCLRVRCCTN